MDDMKCDCYVGLPSRQPRKAMVPACHLNPAMSFGCCQIHRRAQGAFGDELGSGKSSRSNAGALLKCLLFEQF